MESITIEYRFQSDDSDEDAYCLEIDAHTLRLLNPKRSQVPAWARLRRHQCPNCPLEAGRGAFCPAAENMTGLVNRFDHLLSCDQTKVAVITPERRICSETTLQRGVCSLMGLLMATSDCPRTAFFKPMARFHLPFANTVETIWRATTTYLLAQYYLQQEGRPFDLNFDGLSKLYSDIQIVNRAFVKRLKEACRQDSMANGIILLDMYSKSMPLAIDTCLQVIRPLFMPYLSYKERTSH